VSLATPPKLQRLQEALYTQAEQEPAYRFYLLYDKVYRADILAHAYALSKQHGGAPGVDGVTFEDIERDGRERWQAAVREAQHEQPLGEVRALSRRTADPQLPPARDVVDTPTQLRQRQVHGSLEVPARELVGLPHVEQHGARPADLGPFRERHVAPQRVGRHHAGHVDGVLGRAELRSVSELGLGLGEIVHAAAHLDHAGDHVDSLVDPLLADCLRAEEAAVLARVEELLITRFSAIRRCQS
jgi:hypothetical protein